MTLRRIVKMGDSADAKSDSIRFTGSDVVARRQKKEGRGSLPSLNFRLSNNCQNLVIKFWSKNAKFSD